MIHAMFRGIVGAMAMTGVRVFALHAGLDPRGPAEPAHPQAGARAASRRCRASAAGVVVELVHWAMGAAFGLVFGLLPERDPPQAVGRAASTACSCGPGSTPSSRRRSG